MILISLTNLFLSIILQEHVDDLIRRSTWPCTRINRNQNKRVYVLLHAIPSVSMKLISYLPLPSPPFTIWPTIPKNLPGRNVRKPLSISLPLYPKPRLKRISLER